MGAEWVQRCAGAIDVDCPPNQIAEYIFSHCTCSTTHNKLVRVLMRNAFTVYRETCNNLCRIHPIFYLQLLTASDHPAPSGRRRSSGMCSACARERPRWRDSRATGATRRRLWRNTFERLPAATHPPTKTNIFNGFNFRRLVFVRRKSAVLCKLRLYMYKC